MESKQETTQSGTGKDDSFISFTTEEKEVPGGAERMQTKEFDVGPDYEEGLDLHDRGLLRSLYTAVCKTEEEKIDLKLRRFLVAQATNLHNRRLQSKVVRLARNQAVVDIVDWLELQFERDVGV